MKVSPTQRARTCMVQASDPALAPPVSFGSEGQRHESQHSAGPNVARRPRLVASTHDEASWVAVAAILVGPRPPTTACVVCVRRLAKRLHEKGSVFNKVVVDARLAATVATRTNDGCRLTPLEARQRELCDDAAQCTHWPAAAVCRWPSACCLLARFGRPFAKRSACLGSQVGGACPV